jgi:hypothetical protein
MRRRRHGVALRFAIHPSAPAWLSLGVRHMNASIPQPRRTLRFWASTVIWLSAFVSPSAYFLLVLLASKFQINVPAGFALSLFFLIPIVALLICASVVWSCGKTIGRKVGWMLFTLLAMLLQCGAILLILRVILVATISYP